MRIVRSWPRIEPPGRAHVVDSLPRFLMEDYDYTNLVDYGEDVVVVEWDIAYSPEELQHFLLMVENCNADKEDQIVVAPYKLYERRKYPVWCHRQVNRETGQERWIQPRETEADLFSFGMTFLPYRLLRAFLDSPKETRGTPIGIDSDRYTDYRLTDQTFSTWHFRRGYGTAYVDWDCQPRHLNY